MKPASILIVDDDQPLRETLAILVRQLGHAPVVAMNVTDARRILSETDIDLVVSDLRMPGGTGLDLLQGLREAGDQVPFIVLTAFGTVESAVDAMQRGAIDYLMKPFDAAEAELRIARALAPLSGRARLPARRARNPRRRQQHDRQLTCVPGRT